MAGRRERLIHLLLKERLGGETPPDLSRRIMGSLDRSGGAAPARPLNLWWLGAAAALLVLAAGLGLYAALREQPAAPQNTPQVAQPGVAPAPQPSRLPLAPEGHNAPVPEDVRPQPAPQPEKLPRPETQPQPETQPEPGPGKEPVEGPVVGPPQPEPQPEPVPVPQPKEEPKEQPGDGPVVEEPPVPQPEPGPQPEPAPLPGPGVEKRPEPEKQPGPANPTATPPAVDPARVALVLFQDDDGDLSVRKAGETRFSEWKEGPLAEGTSLKARRAVLLKVGDAKVWFEGELALGLAEGVPALEVADKAVYVDALAATGALVVRRGDLTLEVRDAALVAEEVGRKLRLTCLDGELAWGESRLAAGQSALLSGRGFERERNEGAAAREHKLVQAAAKACNTWREDFTAKTGERLLQGEVVDGVAVSGGVKEGGREGGGKQEAGMKEGGIALRLGGRVVGEGEYLRLRVRLAAPGNLVLRLFADEGGGVFNHAIEKLPAGRWLTITIRLADLRRDDKQLPAGAVAAKLEMASRGGNGQKLELDWVEWSGEPASRR